MKHIQILKAFLQVIVCGAVALVLSCSDDFNSGNTVHKEQYDKVDRPTVCVRNTQSSAAYTVLEIKEDAPITTDLHISLTRVASQDLPVALTVADASALKTYNAEHGTNYQMYSSNLIRLQNDGVSSIAASQLNSESIGVTVEVPQQIDNDIIYAIPLRATSTSELVIQGDVHLLIVKDLRGKHMASSTKSSGIKLFSCMEVGTANPLFHLAFTLKGKTEGNAGKPLFDCVILFSGKIVFDLATQRVKFEPGRSISSIVSNYDKYIKPLHDMGIKVLISVLGSSDNAETSAGVAHLDATTANYFAHEIADYCRAYRIDGVMLDDEYTGTLSHPGLIAGSRENAARLCYELKQAMPDKWVVTYMYSRMYGFNNAINGVEPGDFIDYALNDYGASMSASYYLGMESSQVAAYSTNWSPGYWRNCGTASFLNSVRQNGYGAYMGYCLDFQTSTWSKQLVQLKNIAEYLYDDELVDSGYRPKPEW